jgi:hypothetical protein
LAAQVELIRLRLLQHGPVLVPHQQVPGEAGADREYQSDEESANRERPPAGIARIERFQFF